MCSCTTGRLGPTKELLEAVPELHFGIVGHEPRETDNTDQAGNGWTLEAYDQGRYLGVLNLHPRQSALPKTFANGRSGSKAEVERIERRMEQVEAQIKRLPPATPGNEPPFLKRLREQQAQLKLDLEKAKIDAIKLPDTGAAFVFKPVPMEPGYPLNPKVTELKEAFNKQLEEINAKNPEPIPKPAPGEAEFVGSERCSSCHVQAFDFWKKTAHARAVNTLVKRNKLFDGNCIGCHVTGYRKPGGSVLGKLEYPVKVGDTAFTKKLQDVGCENCHGPGSKHIVAPVGADGKAQHITRETSAETCVGCHNAEHSSKFNYDTYVRTITGEGHVLSSQKEATP